MKNLARFFLIISCLLTTPYMGDAAQQPAYVPGELLVKYKPSVQVAASSYYRTVRGISNIRKFKKIGVDHVKLPKHMNVEEALLMYRNDPDVEYAEPNYYRYATAIPNDPYFDQQWGLQNSGQSLNGSGGTTDADIDAPEAWDITTGSSDVVVAVIDSGVDYNHPDLAANIWTNPGEIAGNGIDDDGNGYVDDVFGWDFFDGDNDPIDSNGHGTHVAGIVAAVGNNSIGVTGVSWTAKIMPLRVVGALGFVSDTVSAIQYASEKGAHVINLSLGGSGFSLTEKAAIDASSAVVVCAAGNGGSDGIGDDNDITDHYPSNYPSSNIIAVAATDQNDELASFSNFGATSVDVAAPGVNIYSTMPARQTVWIDDFDDGDISDWTRGGTNSWGTSNTVFFSGAYSLADSPTVDYLDNSDSWAIAPVRNLSSRNGAKLDFKLRGISESCCDFLYIEVSTDLNIWTPQLISVEGSSIPIFSGSTSDLWLNATVDLGSYDGNSTLYIKFGFISDSNITDDGFYMDDVKVTAASSSYGGSEFEYKDGTSMAAPFVSGLATLIKARYPSMINIEIKSQIESTVDPKASLSNKVATGGRINALNAVNLSVEERLEQLMTSGGGKGGGCFIATAAYGSRMAKKTVILQNFRDKIMLTGSIGKAFVALYYKISPPIAIFITKHKKLKPIVRRGLLSVVGLSWVSHKIGFVPTLLILVLFVSVPSFVFKIHINALKRGDMYSWIFWRRNFKNTKWVSPLSE